MITPLALYKALLSIDVPEDKAQAVLDAWECDMKKLTLKTEMQELKTNTKIQLLEVENNLPPRLANQLERVWSSFFLMNAKFEAVFWPAVILFLFMSIPWMKFFYESLQ